MPIEKVPIVHRFGIISHSQRVELQQRLIEQTFDEYSLTKKPPTDTNYVLEVTDEFVQQHNHTESGPEKDKLDVKANKILERIKRKTGLKSDGVGDHVDLAAAWTQLVQLAECSGPIQQRCLHVLLTSLQRAPVSRQNVAALLFLAETSLYWLHCSDTTWQRVDLSPGWADRLQIGMLVFMRLFHHHMVGVLKRHDSFKNRLFAYLQDFHEYLESYEAHPDALLCLRYIGDVGEMIVGDLNTESGEVKEGDATGEVEDALTLSGAVHDLCPTLWHSLDVWRCVRTFGGAGLHRALPALARCGANMAADSWVDAVCALRVLGDAVRGSLPALQVLQALVCGASPAVQSVVPTTATTDFDRETVKTRMSGLDDTSHKDGMRSERKGNADDMRSERKGNASPDDTLLCGGYVSVAGPASDTSLTDRRTETREDTGRWAENGTAMTEHRQEELVLPTAFTNTPPPGVVGIHGWHWEVAVTYIQVMTDVCLHGATSNIQKMALLGRHREVSEVLQGSSAASSPMTSAGLLDLLFFYAVDETRDGGPNDWSWRVRFSAIDAVGHVCTAGAHDSARSGLVTAAWNAVTRAKSLEQDKRVLDAIRASMVGRLYEPDVRSMTPHVAPPTIGGRLAMSLASLYLPSVPSQRPVVAATLPKPTVTLKPTVDKPRFAPLTQRKLARTTLRQEIDLANTFSEPAVDFKTRTDFDLRRVVEDQWRKQCHERLNTEPPQWKKLNREDCIGGVENKRDGTHHEDVNNGTKHRQRNSRVNTTSELRTTSSVSENHCLP